MASFRDKLFASATTVVAPDEKFQVAIHATTVQSQGGRGGAGVELFSLLVNSNRAIVVTDKRILLCSCARGTGSKIAKVIQVFPRTTKIGPTGDGRNFRTEVLGTTLYISEKSFDLVYQADNSFK